MSILIKGMEMPTSCGECPFFIENRHDRGDDSLCRASGKEAKCGCPLVPVPPHGDLIDRDIARVMSWSDNRDEESFEDGIFFALDWLEKLPTIIPAEEGET